MIDLWRAVYKRFKYHRLAQYPWLCYSKYKDGAFCLCCVLFGEHAKGGGGGGGGDLSVLPSLTGNIHALDKFAFHANNQKLHILPYEQYITFRNTFCSHNTQPVNIQLDKINQDQISSGHRDDDCRLQSPENKSGNFQNLLNLMENAPRNAYVQVKNYTKQH